MLHQKQLIVHPLPPKLLPESDSSTVSVCTHHRIGRYSLLAHIQNYPAFPDVQDITISGMLCSRTSVCFHNLSLTLQGFDTVDSPGLTRLDSHQLCIRHWTGSHRRLFYIISWNNYNYQIYFAISSIKIKNELFRIRNNTIGHTALPHPALCKADCSAVINRGYWHIS